MSWGKIKIRQSDKLFREYILKTRKHFCEHCGRSYPDGKGLEISHFFGRRSESTRYDPDNVDLCCSGCHRLFHERPADYSEWKKKKLGEKLFKELMVRANTIKKRDDKMTCLILKSLLKDFER